MINFNNSYEKLSPALYSKEAPVKVNNPSLIKFNHELASELEIEIDPSFIEEYFSGNKRFENGSYIAQAYAGHQFGHFNPRLGDGRALLIGEINAGPKRFDLQLKGSGRTAFSRNGDGKSPLGPVLREYLVSEAMHQLGVPTTRALCAIETGEPVYREQTKPGAIFTRVASSHIRIGTFEYIAMTGDLKTFKDFVEYTIARHFPEIANDDNPALSLLLEVAKAQSSLVAKWMALGFIHGVMNTDNMAISGETIDYGPCAFMDHYKSNQVFSYIDSQGRYAYNNQIPIAIWNLYRFASTLIPLVDSDEKVAISKIEKTLLNIDALYQSTYLKEMGKKFGLNEASEKDIDLIQNWFQYLEEEGLDFTNSFRTLVDSPDALPETPLYQKFQSSFQKLNIDHELMDKNNPYFIPRNHLVEKAITAAEKGDYSFFNELLKAIQSPYSISHLKDDQFLLLTPPKKEEVVANTFCGT